jgi:hypothetical protein
VINLETFMVQQSQVILIDPDNVAMFKTNVHLPSMAQFSATFNF